MEQNSKKRKKRQGRQSEAQSLGFEAVAQGTVVGSGSAVICMSALALVSTALCMMSPDPASLSLPVGLSILYISSAVGGFVSSLKLKREPSAALTAAALCGFTVFVLTGICSTLQAILSPESSHGIGIWVALVLRLLAIAPSMLASYVSCKAKPQKHRRRR